MHASDLHALDVLECREAVTYIIVSTVIGVLQMLFH